MTVDPAVLEELGRLRARLPQLSASVFATTDGMVVAHDSYDIEPDSIAALAAVHVALVRRLVHAVNQGELRESVVECDFGYVTSYLAGPDALLTLISSANANLALVHPEARRCARRLTALLTVELPRMHSETPAQAGAIPLARRTPMATLPNGSRYRQATG